MKCEGCLDPRDFDINWISMQQEEVNTTPKRPGSKMLEELDDDFMTDFENSCLSLWDSSKRPHPRGRNRHEDVEWAALVRRYVYPNLSDVDWYEYIIFVESGGGDDFFLQNEGKSCRAFEASLTQTCQERLLR